MPAGGFENSPRGEIGDAGVDGSNPALNTRRARHHYGTGLDQSLVPPGGFENSPRWEMSDAGVDGPNPALRPEEPGTVAVPGSTNLWCPRADSNRRHPL